ncbi:MAG: TolC family protein [Phycisphaerales bacterium]|nr:TolC family protein [Phycisphaerales bacterium]
MGTTICVAVNVSLPGCNSPFADYGAAGILQRSVSDAISQELLSVNPQDGLVITTQPPTEIADALKNRMAVLSEMGPRKAGPITQTAVGPNLMGEAQQQIVINLDSVIESALRHNLDLKIAQLQPAINQQDVIVAEAAFDVVFLASGQASIVNQPQQVILFPNPGGGGGNPSQDFEYDDNMLRTRQYEAQVGLSKQLITGGSLQVSNSLWESDNRNLPADEVLSPNPAYFSTINFAWDQPLLQGFGEKVNTAQIRIARNIQRSSVEDLRSGLQSTIVQTELAYWDLVNSWQNLSIQQWLIDVGVEVKDILERRRGFDVDDASYADGVATLQDRRTSMISIRNELRQKSDALKVLINNPEYPIQSDTLLFPLEDLNPSPIEYSLQDALFLAVANRPDIRQSLLSIDSRAAQELVAKNNVLPELDLNYQMVFYGLGKDVSDAYETVSSGNGINFIIGLAYQQPIGNRAAEAEYYQSRLNRASSILAYKNTILQAALEVKTQLRNVVASYQLIGATRELRIAAAESLRALDVLQQTLESLTPTFLNLKYQKQSALASAQAQEYQALTGFYQSLAQLYQAMGITLSMNRIAIEQASPEIITGGKTIGLNRQ